MNDYEATINFELGAGPKAVSVTKISDSVGSGFCCLKLNFSLLKHVEYLFEVEARCLKLEEGVR